MIEVKATFTIPKIPLFNRNAANAVVRREYSVGLRSAMLYAAGELAKRTPVGVSGRLRANWLSTANQRIDVVNRAPVVLHGQVLNTMDYAIAVDQGRPANSSLPPWGPGSDLERWVQLKIGRDVSVFVIARAIARRGTRPARIVSRTLRVVRRPVQRILDEATTRVSRALRGLS